MSPKLFFRLCIPVALLLFSCGGGVKKKERLDRTILGEELAFGRKAAEFELWREAIFRWEKVVREQPDNSDALNNLGVAYESIGDFEKAGDFYKTALEYDEDADAIRKNYKRFLSFYKKHKRQLAREQRAKEARQDAESDEEEKEEGGAQ